MAPSALSNTPREDVDNAAELTSAALATKLAETKAINSGNSHLAPLDASAITYTFAQSPKAVPGLDHPERYTMADCTDHMVVAVWNNKTGWQAPELKPYGPFSLMPTTQVFHYATECFEGMKCYRGYDGRLRLFRPDCNAERFLTSCSRITLPGFEPKEIEKLVLALMEVDGPKWLPKDLAGHCLYLRPTMMGTGAALGVGPAKEATFFCIATYMPDLSQPKGLRLLASQDDMVRAWPGGFGYAKLGANYAPTFLAQQEAMARGYNQVLWLLNDSVTEAGASNFFVLWRNKAGALELVTAPIDDKIILPGVTRRSILELARERLGEGNKYGLEKVDVVERKFTMTEVLEAVKEGRMVEAFASGTAVSLLLLILLAILILTTCTSTSSAPFPRSTTAASISPFLWRRVTLVSMPDK